jgi:hypothetical protein
MEATDFSFDSAVPLTAATSYQLPHKPVTGISLVHDFLLLKILTRPMLSCYQYRRQQQTRLNFHFIFVFRYKTKKLTVGLRYKAYI